jgi:hypothetical protein
MLGLFYQGYHIVGSCVYVRDTGRWTSKVTIYPPAKIIPHPTVLVGAEGSCATECEAEKEAVRMARQWVDRLLG